MLEIMSSAHIIPYKNYRIANNGKWNFFPFALNCWCFAFFFLYHSVFFLFFASLPAHAMVFALKFIHVSISKYFRYNSRTEVPKSQQDACIGDNIQHTTCDTKRIHIKRCDACEMLKIFLYYYLLWIWWDEEDSETFSVENR